MGWLFSRDCNYCCICWVSNHYSIYDLKISKNIFLNFLNITMTFWVILLKLKRWVTMMIFGMRRLNTNIEILKLVQKVGHSWLTQYNFCVVSKCKRYFFFCFSWKMSINCCNCFFNYDLLKINRNPNFLKKINLLNPNDWPNKEYVWNYRSGKWFNFTRSF